MATIVTSRPNSPIFGIRTLQTQKFRFKTCLAACVKTFFKGILTSSLPKYQKKSLNPIFGVWIPKDQGLKLKA